MISKHLLIVFVCSLLISSCQTKKQVAESSPPSYKLADYCPEDGTCTFEVLTHKSLEMKSDGIGALYPVVKNGDKTVLKFEYKKIQDPKLADDGYKEVIYAKINTKQDNLQLKNEKLNLAKVYFGRLCFCKGESGYYPVKQGKLMIQRQSDSTVTYSLKFEMDRVPQIIKEFYTTEKI
ncbi:hypothetical protein [Psychroflexus lacisalsi]|uniref:hypothetical protein n=1 Tax=Psychroflexus lacisalsi TaxID=503928 RepID=UPI001CCD89A1|nr:hypothetical protein [Psychroflexus lacisalsi]MBZ9621160.1 hypothetical protein [Psychroflexus lacisalsi]